jgi:hypothetical protein
MIKYTSPATVWERIVLNNRINNMGDREYYIKKYFIDVFNFKYILFILTMLLTINSVSASEIFKQRFNWQYLGKTFTMELILNSKTYDYYKKSDKRLLFTKEASLGKFLNIKDNDNLIKMITDKLIVLARKNEIPQEKLPEFASAFVQFIPYDSIKAVDILAENWSPDTDIYFHYETVYMNKGVCTDKSILLVSILRNMGYGTALLLMDSAHHAAAAIACPIDKSINKTGYCYIETTAPLPIGYIPKNININEIEIFQKSAGKAYNGF